MEQKPDIRIKWPHKNTIGKFMGALLVVGLSAGLVLAFTDTQSDWYGGLVRSPLQPPDWAFSLIWGIQYVDLFFCLFVLSLRNIRGRMLHASLVNLVLLPLLHYIFFATRNPVMGMVVLVLTLFYGILMALYSMGYSKWVALALVPFLIWVTFALVLNYTIVMLN